MSNGDKNCTNCRYFKPGPTPSGFPGWCVRNPPVQHTMDSKYSFVEVDEAAWCGEYKQVTG